MAALLKVELVTPSRRLFSVDAESVTFTGTLGEMTVLPGHIALITSTLPGPLSIKTTSGTEVYAVGIGTAQIDGDHVVLLAESAEPAADIDVSRAEKALQEATRAMRDRSFYDENYEETLSALGRATARLQIAKR